MATVSLRLPDDEAARWRADAKTAGLSLTDFIRGRVNRDGPGVVAALPGYDPARGPVKVTRPVEDTAVARALSAVPEAPLRTGSCMHGPTVTCPTCR